MNNPIPTMLTIEATARQTGLSAHFVRQLVLTKRIVHVRAGSKYLVNLDRFVEFLNNGETAQPDTEHGKIRRIDGR